MKITSALWFYYFSKAIEFFNTIFMVIRKRFTQITFLHVFHHSTMLLIWWIVMTWIPVKENFVNLIKLKLINMFINYLIKNQIFF